MNIHELFSETPRVTLKMRGKTVEVSCISDAAEACVRSAFDAPRASLILDPHAPASSPRTIEDVGDPAYKLAVRELGHNLAAAEAGLMMNIEVGGSRWEDVAEKPIADRRAFIRSVAAAVRGVLSSEEIAAVVSAGVKSAAVLEQKAKKD